MRRTAVSLVLAAALVLVGSLPSDAARRGHHGGRRHFGGGTHIFIRVLPGYSYPYWWDYPAAYYYYAPRSSFRSPPSTSSSSRHRPRRQARRCPGTTARARTPTTRGSAVVMRHGSRSRHGRNRRSTGWMGRHAAQAPRP